MGNCGRRQCEFAAPIVAMECDAGILLVAKNYSPHAGPGKVGGRSGLD